MNKEIKTVSEYLTPKCKTVRVSTNGVLCGSFDSVNNTEKFTEEEEEGL